MAVFFAGWDDLNRQTGGGWVTNSSQRGSKRGGGRGGGDPHFFGPDGQQYDVSGVINRWHNLYSAPEEQVNALFQRARVPDILRKASMGADTRITEITINTASGDTVDFTFRRAPKIEYHNGVTERMRPGKTYTLDNGKVQANWHYGHLAINTSTVDMDLKSSRFMTPWGHLNEKSEYHPKPLVTSGAVQPHGIIGQLLSTERQALYGELGTRSGDVGPEAQGGGVLETIGVNGERQLSNPGDNTAIEHYLTSGPKQTDDKFSRFTSAAGNPFA